MSISLTFFNYLTNNFLKPKFGRRQEDCAEDNTLARYAANLRLILGTSTVQVLPGMIPEHQQLWPQNKTNTSKA